jgi:hypothetical protein
VFVHDFVRLNLPYEEVVARFGATVDPWLGVLVASAWRNDMPTWIASGVDERDLVPPAIVPVWLGVPRQRNDATIVRIAWPPVGGRFVSGLDADLEIVACGPNLTDVQLLGRYEFADGIQRWTAEASLAHRIAVSVVRRFLELLSERLVGDDRSSPQPDLFTDEVPREVEREVPREVPREVSREVSRHRIP